MLKEATGPVVTMPHLAPPRRCAEPERVEQVLDRDGGGEGGVDDRHARTPTRSISGRRSG